MATRETTKAKTKGKRPVAARDERFVDLVAKGESATKAYVKAGFKNTKNTRINACQKLTKPNISSALEERRAYFRSIANVEAKDIIGAYSEMAFSSIEDAMDENGYLDFKKAKRNGSAKLIKKIHRSRTKEGENVTVEFYPRTDALNKLTEILGLQQLPKENEADSDAAKLRARIQIVAEQNGTTYQEELRIYLEEYAADVQPKIKEKLASELVQ